MSCRAARIQTVVGRIVLVQVDGGSESGSVGRRLQTPPLIEKKSSVQGDSHDPEHGSKTKGDQYDDQPPSAL
jgi:hypothetical protein